MEYSGYGEATREEVLMCDGWAGLKIWGLWIVDIVDNTTQYVSEVSLNALEQL